MMVTLVVLQSLSLFVLISVSGGIARLTAAIEKKNNQFPWPDREN